MAKRYKIKRYNKIYRTDRRAIARRVVLWVAGLAVLAFIGYCAYGPVVNFLSGKYSGSKPDLSKSSSAASSSTEKPVEKKDDSYRSVDRSQLATPQQISDTVAGLADAGVTRVLIELKDDSGMLYYRSQNQQASAAGAISDQAVDLDAFIAACKEKDIQVAAVLSALKDPLMAGYDKSSAILYGDGSYIWLDDTAANGGKPWLNPNAGSTRQYLQSLCTELCEKGVSEIVLKDAVYPNGLSQSMMNFGFTSASQTKQSALQDLIQQLQTAVGEKGGILSLVYDNQWLYEDSVNEVNYKALTADRFYLDTALSTVETGTVLGDYTVPSGATQQEVSQKLYDYYQQKIPGVIAFGLQGTSITQQTKGQFYNS